MIRFALSVVVPKASARRGVAIRVKGNGADEGGFESKGRAQRRPSASVVAVHLANRDFTARKNKFATRAGLVDT